MAGYPQSDAITLTAGVCGTDIGVGGLVDATTVDTYTPLDVLNAHCNSYSVWDVIKPKYKSFFRTLWFASAQAEGDTETIPTNINMKVEGSLSVDGKSVMWGERARARLFSNITSDVTAGNNVFVDNPEAYQIGDVVRITHDVSGCTVEIYRNVTAIATGAAAINNYITVDGSAMTIDADAGEPRVYFLYHPYSCGDTITTSAQYDVITDKKSYFQIFAEKVCFTDEFINTCYTGTGAAGEASEAVAAKWEYVRQRLYTGIVGAFFFGAHKGTGAPQTMGIIKAIKEEDMAGTSVITDVSGATTVDAKIIALMDELEAVSAITEDVTQLQVIANDKFMQSLIRANAVWGRITGCTKMCDAGQNSVKSYGGLYDIELSNGVRVNFVSDAALTHFYPNESVAIIAPVGYAAFYTHQNEMRDMKVVAKNGLIKWNPIQKNYALVACETCYAIQFYLANVFVGVSSGLRRIVLGF